MGEPTALTMKPFRPFLLLALAVALIGLWLSPARGVSLTDSRIRQLEYGLRSLQAQVNQLQSQLPRSTGDRAPAPAVSAAPVPGDPSLAEQFDNLATLVIELSQRVSALESQAAENSPER